MQASMLQPLSVKKYLEAEEHAVIRHEYVARRVHAMAVGPSCVITGLWAMGMGCSGKRPMVERSS